MAFPALDVVFGLTTGAIDFLVTKLLRWPIRLVTIKRVSRPIGPTSMRAMTRRSLPHERAP